MENHCTGPYVVSYNDTELICLLRLILLATHLMSVSPLTLQTDSSVAYYSAGCGPALVEQEPM